MRYSKCVIKSHCDAQKVMAKYGFGSKFYDIKYFAVEFKFIFLEFILNLRVAPQFFFCRKTSILSYSKQI